MKFDFISDPGHAWLKVPLKLLKQYELLNSITSFSYIRGKFAYLEEDCDASIFITALENDGINIEFRERIAGFKQSRIRNYDCFSVELALQNL